MPFELPTDFPRSAVQTSHYAYVSLQLVFDITAALVALARESGRTDNALLLAALSVLFHRYTGETDISFGVEPAGRDDAALYHADLSGDPTFGEVLASARDPQPIASGRLLIEPSDAWEPKRHRSRNPFYSVAFVFERASNEETSAPRYTPREFVSYPAPFLVDLRFTVTERFGNWALGCEYDTDLFEEETLTALLAAFEALLSSIAADPDTRVSRMPLLSGMRREQLVLGANDTSAPYPAERTVADLFTAQAHRTPEAIAVICGTVTMTYAELDASSNKLARALLRRELGPHKRVGVLLERSVDLVVALLAVIKAGSAYVPLDPGYPRERLAFIVPDARIAAIVSRSTLNERIGDAGAAFVNIDTDAAAIARHSEEPLETHVTLDDPAYVIYTSGSTGRPKGVEVAERGLINALHALSGPDAFDIGENDVHVAVATVSFDIATLDVFLPLVNGARLILADASEAGDSYALHRLLQRSRATFMQATPIVFELLMEAGWSGDPALKIHCGGEAISRRLANQLIASGNRVWNGYGPTETTIVSSIGRVARGTAPVLMGPPIANTQFYVLDANGELLPPGAIGELYIGGDGVAIGYVGRPDLTLQRFLPDTFHDVPGSKLYRTGDLVRRRGAGTFEFMGRADQQVKIRGFRIELGEIEATLLRQRDVLEAVAIVRGNAAAEKTIWAFVVGPSQNCASQQAWVARLRSDVSDALPPYMVPAPIVVLDALPRLPSGKVDRAALLQAEFISAAFLETPANPTETMLIELIGEMLGLASVGRSDDIFALGFHSLLAVRLVDRIERVTGARVPLRALYDAQTVARLALRIAEASSAAPVFDEPQPITTLNPHGSRPPFFYLHNDLIADGMYCRRLAKAVGSAQPIHAIAPHGTAGLPAIDTVEQMARDYVRQIRDLQPNGPYRLGGICAAGLVAYEVARLVTAQGGSVERLVLINALPVTNGTNLTAGRLIRTIALCPLLRLRFRENFCYNVVRLFDALDDGPRGFVAFLGERTRTVYRRLTHRTPKKLPEAESPAEHRSNRKIESIIAHIVAPLTYRPRAYSGEVTLFWSTDERRAAIDAESEWSSVAKSTRLVAIAGGHISPVQDGVEDFGRALREVLD